MGVRPTPRPAHQLAPNTIVRSPISRAVATLDAVGLCLDPWQREIFKYMVAEREDGLYAASRVVMSIPRQAGKTYLVGLLCIYDAIAHPGTTTVWTAHRFKVARETFDFMQAVCTTPKMSRYVDKAKIHSAAGNESINFRNGSRIVFAARERGAIRGFSKVRRIIFDEAQILSNQALADLLPTQNQAWNPQRILMGTPPSPTNQSEAFLKARTSALEGKTTRTYYVEYSAQVGSSIDDIDAWITGNPSLLDRTPLERITDLREELPDEDDFAREAMGMWDAAGSNDVIDAVTWQLAERTDDVIPTTALALGISVAADLSAASVAFAGKRPDGRAHVELLAQRNGYLWVAAYCRKLLDDNPSIRAVVLDIGSASRVLVDDFKKHRIYLTLPKVIDVGTSTAMLVDGLVNGETVHIGQVQLETARSGARKRPLGDTGLWAWSRKNSITDITPIEGITLAHWGSTTLAPTKPVRRSGRKVIVPS